MTHPRSRVAHPFAGHASFEGRSSRRYAWLARGLLRGVYRRIAEDIALTAPPSGAVLDVGTGPGVLIAEIARQRPDLQVSGIDRSADMITAANHTIGQLGDRVSARVGDVTNLAFPDSSFDLVVTTFSLHHWDDVASAVPELARVLRPGGALYVYDFQRAPFDALDTAARTKSVFTQGPAHHGVIHTGRPPIRRCVRHVMISAAR